ncbi:MAG TPA: hypothetical protein VNT54_05000 [Solirubrobacteraceae bacterium]|nr:hypothetical protein [Solirubrobacteraceae bacterium]
MATIDAVELRGGPADGQRPEPMPGTALPPASMRSASGASWRASIAFRRTVKRAD